MPRSLFESWFGGYLKLLAAVIVAVGILVFTAQSVSSVINTTIPEFQETHVEDDDVGDLDRYFYFDVNMDGTDDVILTPFGGTMTGQVRVFVSQNDGTFAEPDYYDITSSGVTRLQGAYHADIDGDGDNDFMAPGVGSTTSSLIFVNDGTGSFSFQTLPNSLSNPTAAIIPLQEQDEDRFRGGFLDLDGDNDLDYVGTDFSGDDWATYIYDGTTYVETIYNNTYTLGSAVANYGWGTDIDDDGDIDIIQHTNGAAAGVDVQFNVWENDGTGVFTEGDIFTGDPTRGVNYRNSHAVFDIDGDGDKDLISEGNETGNFIVHQNDGANSFSQIQTINYEPGEWIQTYYSDLDNDGDIDIGLWDTIDGNSTAIYHNDGSGVFSFVSIEPISYGITTQDFNSDGELDIISAPGRSIGLGTEGFVQFGDGPFSYESTVYTLYDYGDEMSQFEVRDFTGDGFEDILISESDYYPANETGDENKFTIFTNTDNDQDGLPNEDEIVLGSDNTTDDSDNDGLSDLLESTSDTSIINPDTDGDGIKDGIEDANQNGVVDEGETDPTDEDSDDDGLTDGEEDANKNGIVDPGEIDPTKPSSDNDNVSEQEEFNAPNNGDSNDDGIKDAAQDSVATKPNPNADNKYHTLTVDESSSCDQISTLSYGEESELKKQDGQYQFPLGLFDFSIQCSDTGETADITIILDQDYDTSEWGWRKYNPTTGQYIDMTEQVAFDTVDIAGTTKTTATFEIEDGATFDDDGEANGTIFDPSGPTVLQESTEADEEELAETGLEAIHHVVFGFVILPLMIITAELGKKRIIRL